MTRAAASRSELLDHQPAALVARRAAINLREAPLAADNSEAAQRTYARRWPRFFSRGRKVRPPTLPLYR
ncbi:hypothetical protein EDC02_4911 [Micromonospora sp. Llam0]|nr:hypothetical protein EDC02_4911 [Micromonospora sp. Llam0]